MHLSLVVPAYNEEKNLYKNIRLYNEYLSGQSFAYEIIIVNDGSGDRTAEVAKRLRKELGIKFIDNKINRGKGYAVKEGMLSARGFWRAFLDADNATSIDHLGSALKEAEKGYELVIGSRNNRDCPGACQVLPQPFWKRFFGSGGNLLIQSFFVRGVWDTQCGFKLFSGRLAEEIFPRLRIDRWATDIEMIALAQKKGKTIGIIPVRWKNSDYSRVGLKGYFITLFELLKIKKNFLFKKYD